MLKKNLKKKIRKFLRNLIIAEKKALAAAKGDIVAAKEIMGNTPEEMEAMEKVAGEAMIARYGFIAGGDADGAVAAPGPKIGQIDENFISVNKVPQVGPGIKKIEVIQEAAAGVTAAEMKELITRVKNEIGSRSSSRKTV